MAKNKSLKVLSTASVAGMVAAAVLSSQAFAAVDAYSVKVDNDVFQYSKADLTDSFLASKAGEAAPLYEDFLAKFEKASGFYAFHDAKTEKYVSVADITEKYLEAKAAGTEFVVDTYTESKDAKVLEVPTVKKVVVKDGKVVIENEQVELKVDSVSAINAKGLKVIFNKAVDTTKATFAVSKAGITANVSKVEWNEDKTEATLTLATKLTKGEYTVKAAGVELAVAEGKATVEDEKVGQIQILSNNAVLDASDAKIVTVGYKALNQYGEDATKTFESGLTFTAGKGTALASNGVITITAGSVFTKDEKVTLSALDAATGIFTTTTLTVSDKAAVSDVVITGIYNSDSKAVLDENATASNFKLVIDAKDQYGNSVAYDKIAADTVMTVSDPSIITVAGGPSTPTFAETTIDGVKKPTVALAAPVGGLKAGKTTITLLSKTTGKMSKYDVIVSEAAKTDVMTMSVPELAVAGEKIEIPFSVTDQYGKSVTKFSGLNGHVTFSTTAGTASFVQNYVDGTAKLVLDATGLTAAQKVTITATTEKSKIVLLTVDVKAPAVATVITGTKDLVTNVAVGGKFTFANDASKFVVKDQYGRDFDFTGKLTNVATATGKYRLAVLKDSTDDKVTLSGSTTVGTQDVSYVDGTSAAVDVTGAKVGTSTLTVKLQKADGSAFVDVTSSDLTLNVGVSEKKEFTSYEIGDLKPIYDDAASAYTRDLVVYGVKADGSKVVVPSSLYTVTTNNAALTYSAGKLDANKVVVAPDYKDVTVKVTVVVDSETVPTTLTKEVVVTKPALHVASAEWKTDGNVTVKDGVIQVKAADLAGLTDTLKLKDQFEGTFALDLETSTTPETNATITFTTLKDAAKTTDTPAGSSDLSVTNNGAYNATITGAESGDTFNMTIAVDGNTYTIPVVVIP